MVDHSALTEYDAEDVLIVNDPEQLRALAGSVRSRIVMLLRERAASTSELAHAMGIPKGTAAHHVKVLEHAGLIRVVATRQVRAVTEKFYGRVARLYVLKTDEDAEGVIGDNALAAVLLRQASEELLDGEVDPARVTAGLTYARLLPDDARRLGIRLNKLFADVKAAENAKGEPFGLAGSLYPAPGGLPPRSGDA